MPPTPKTTRRPLSPVAKAPPLRTAAPAISVAALMQRMTHAPHTLTPQQIHTLQRTVGNRVVAQTLQRQDTVESVIQRDRGPKKRRVGATRQSRIARVIVKAGEITSVSFKGTSRPASGRGKQGDHLSAYVSFTAMIENNVRKTQVRDFTATVATLVAHIQGLEGMKGQWGRYLNALLRENVLKPADNLVVGRGMATRMGAILYQLAAIRNQVPGTAAIHAKSTGGHDESSKNARLKDTEHRLARGEDPRFEKSILIKDVWGMLDYRPTKSIKQSTIINRLAEHINGMAFAYPKAVVHISKSGVYKYLEDTHYREVFKKMITQNAKIVDMLAKVKAQVGV